MDGWTSARVTSRCHYTLRAANSLHLSPTNGSSVISTFGLSSAPSCFQKIMASIFAGIPGVASYLDDIVVHKATAKSHDKREKCVFAAPAIEFVGFYLSADGTYPLHSNTAAIHRGGDVERLIAFASQALSPHSVGEREALACLWACDHWHMYLYRRVLMLRTYHQTLTTLLASVCSTITACSSHWDVTMWWPICCHVPSPTHPQPQLWPPDGTRPSMTSCSSSTRPFRRRCH